MFEKSLQDNFKKIFDVKKVTYNQPSDSKEQDCIFIEVETSTNTIKDGRSLAKVMGKGTMTANADKMPFGFFSKAIRNADKNITASFTGT